MYFSHKNNFYHGIMFHHFHDGNIYKKTPGSINKDDLFRLIKFIGRKNILDAEDFFTRSQEDKLKEKDLCFTFDDGIKNQHDIALPILEDFKIKSFFFVYSSLFTNNPDFLEVYRHFRSNYFSNINEFYNLFYKKIDKNLKNFFNSFSQQIKDLNAKFPHYSGDDIKFVFVRDKFLKKNEYQEIMLKMFEEKNFKPKKFFNILFMNKENLIKLKELGHMVGLHSHTHPTDFKKLTIKEQYDEYSKNITILSDILKCQKNEIKSMSHPCGSYDENTLQILKELGIELGFKPTMKIEKEKNMKKINNSKLEIARVDHAEIMKKINQ